MKNKTVCEHGLLIIKCPKNLYISIENAWYGRNDNFTCLVCDLCNKTCYLNITDKIGFYFNGKNEYSLKIDNHFAGIDPCYGTFKYSRIDYTCGSLK